MAFLFRCFLFTNKFRFLANPWLQSLAKQIPSVLAGSRAPSTTKGSLSYFQKWKAWASLFPECKYFPANETYVSLYLLNLMQSGYSFSSITSAFYAISFFHNSCDVPNPCDSKFLKRVLEACKRLLSSSVSHR